jgi:hypothetical protein
VGECLELHLNALLFMLIACIIRHCRHGVYDSKNSRRNNTYGGSPNASIAKLGLKNGPSMIEDEVRVDDFCRQTVLHRLATMIYHIRNWIKYNLTRVEFKFKTAKAYFVHDDKVKPRM